MIHFFLHSSLFFIRKIINRLIYLSYNIIYLHIHAWSKGKNIIPHKLDKCVSRKMKGWNLLLRIFRYSFAEVVKCFQGRKRSIHRRNWTCLTHRQSKEEKKHCNCRSLVSSLLYFYFCHFYLSRKNFQFQDPTINCLFS